MPSGNFYPFGTLSVGTTATPTSTSFGDIYAVTAEGTSYITWIGM